MFAWLTDVCAASGFVQGEAWAYERNLLWQQWKIAFATWWPVRAVKAPFFRSSAWLARHPKVGPWTRRIWIVVALAVLYYFGPRPVAEAMPWPMPSALGWVASGWSRPSRSCSTSRAFGARRCCARSKRRSSCS